jgi:hypothetical protein
MSLRDFRDVCWRPLLGEQSSKGSFRWRLQSVFHSFFFKVNLGADCAIPRTILFGQSLPQILLNDSVSLVSKDTAQMECFSRLSGLLETRGSSMQSLEQSAHETDVVGISNPEIGTSRC